MNSELDFPESALTELEKALQTHNLKAEDAIAACTSPDLSAEHNRQNLQTFCNLAPKLAADGFFETPELAKLTLQMIKRSVFIGGTHYGQQLEDRFLSLKESFREGGPLRRPEILSALLDGTEIESFTPYALAESFLMLDQNNLLDHPSTKKLLGILKEKHDTVRALYPQRESAEIKERYESTNAQFRDLRHNLHCLCELFVTLEATGFLNEKVTARLLQDRELSSLGLNLMIDFQRALPKLQKNGLLDQKHIDQWFDFLDQACEPDNEPGSLRWLQLTLDNNREKHGLAPLLDKTLLEKIPTLQPHALGVLSDILLILEPRELPSDQPSFLDAEIANKLFEIGTQPEAKAVLQNLLSTLESWGKEGHLTKKAIKDIVEQALTPPPLPRLQGDLSGAIRLSDLPPKAESVTAGGNGRTH